MPSNSSATVYGGAGGRDSKMSVARLQGLLGVKRNQREREYSPAAPTKPAAAPTQAAPAAPADDKQTLRGLNGRLSGYLGKVRDLEVENKDLERQIDEILAKRKAPEARNWDEVEKPLEDLKKKIKDIAIDNAKLLLQIDNAKLANNDFRNKLVDERKARKELEKDVEDLRKTKEDTYMNRQQTLKEIDLVKEEIDRLKREHKDEVDVLCDKIKNSDVKVEIDSKNVNLGEMLSKIRDQYDKLAKKSQRDADDWYQRKFDNITVADTQNNEALLSGKKELKDLNKQKQFLEIQIQTLLSMIHNLEDTLISTKVENGHRLAPFNKVILGLEAELQEVRSKVERQVDINTNLLGVKMRLEAEIAKYQRLIQGTVPDAESLEFSLDEALHSDQRTLNYKVPNHEEAVQEEVLVMQESAPSYSSTPPKAPEDAEADKPSETLEEDLFKAE